MPPSTTHAPVGLLAGSGRFPIIFARKARELNIPVVALGVIGEASEELASLCDRFHWVGFSRMGRAIRCFKGDGVREIVMAGKVHKVRLNTPYRLWYLLPDWRTFVWYFFRRPKDNRDDALTLSIIDEFARDGLTFRSALDFCPELLVKPGILTKRGVSSSEQADIEFGWEMAKEMGRLDIGQSVAVREKAVLAVEAIEGTDRAILRAGELCPRGGIVVVKVAKPQQDMRFDVPTVGITTIESMRKAGANVLAVEADRTIFIDQDDTIALANRYGISIVARKAA